MVVGTLSLVQKGQTSGCSGCSGIVVYGGGDIVKGHTSGFSGCSHTVDTVHSGYSRHSTQ